VGPGDAEYKRVEDWSFSLGIQVTGFSISTMQQKKHAVYDVETTVQGCQYKNKNRWSVIREFHLQCFAVSKRLKHAKSERYKLKFPDKWTATFDKAKLEGRRAELNQFFSQV
jgi:hypothetical protein